MFHDSSSLTYEEFLALSTKITGTEGDDTLTGSVFANNIVALGGNDVLYGLDNSDILNGGTGADTMYGGLGNDKYIVDDAGDIVTELADEGTDTVESSITYTLTDNVENLTLVNIGAINGTGNDLDNIITGNNWNNQLAGGAGDDILDGRTGADTLLGGTGDDIYIVDNSNDIVTELLDEGYDEVQSSASFTLSDNVEDLILTGSNAINGTGNALDNAIYGNSADNHLYGLAGNDTLDGGEGADSLEGGLGDDTYYWEEGYGNDTIMETGGEDTLASSTLYSSDLEFALSTQTNYGTTWEPVHRRNPCGQGLVRGR